MDPFFFWCCLMYFKEAFVRVLEFIELRNLGRQVITWACAMN